MSRSCTCCRHDGQEVDRGSPRARDPCTNAAARHNLAVVEDCCQAHQATCGGQPVGTFGQAAAFSFYPTKNLGAMGDGGALCTNDNQLADRVASLRDGGQTRQGRAHRDWGQFAPRCAPGRHSAHAATATPQRTERRRAIAAAYRRGLVRAPVAIPPELDAGHVYHLFPVRSERRDALRAHLRSQGIGTLVHYPTPVPRQPAFSRFTPAECPVANAACDELLSLPLYPELADESVDRVCDVLKRFS